MGFGFRNRKDNLSEELKMLPSETKKRILSNVNKRKAEIIQEKLLERELKDFKSDNKKEKKGWGDFKQGMQKRRGDLKAQGIIKPVVRYNQENFKSPLEELSRQARNNEIIRLESQRNNLKSGCTLGMASGGIKLKPVKLKAPKDNLGMNKKKGKKNGFI